LKAYCLNALHLNCTHIVSYAEESNKNLAKTFDKKGGFIDRNLVQKADVLVVSDCPSN